MSAARKALAQATKKSQRVLAELPELKLHVVIFPATSSKRFLQVNPAFWSNALYLERVSMLDQHSDPQK